MSAVADRLAAALQFLLDSTDSPPDRNCSCHISAPCADCADHAGMRMAIADASDALAAHGRESRQVGEVQGDANVPAAVHAYNVAFSSTEHSSRVEAGVKAVLKFAARQPGEHSPDLLAAARDFYNDTVGDVTVRIRCTSDEHRDRVTAAGERLRAALVASPVQAPIPMVLHYPRCHLQHVDAPDERTPGWQNPPHRSHLCHGCGFIWRPADVPTIGVERTQTAGNNDTPFAPPAQGIDLGQLQRYALDDGFDRHRGVETDKGAHLYEHDDGDWVKWDDVDALIDQRDAAPGVGNG